MCAYCKNVDTGNDYNPILTRHVDFGFFGNVDVDVYLTRSSNKSPMMVLGLCENNGSGEAEHIQIIKYCPMCGRDLTQN